MGGNKLLLAEFKYQGAMYQSFGRVLDQTKPNRVFYLMKRFLFPFAYWNLAPWGLWKGKRTLGL